MTGLTVERERFIHVMIAYSVQRATEEEIEKIVHVVKQIPIIDSRTMLDDFYLNAGDNQAKFEASKIDRRV